MSRRFIDVVPSRVSDAHAATALTVVTYNILADKYATSGVHAYASDAQLAWSNRGPRILTELQGYSAHVLCLQEVEEQVFENELLGALTDYDGLYFPRAAGPNKDQGPEEGVALLARRDRVTVLAHDTFRFSEHLPAWIGGACREEAEARPDGAIVALLHDNVLGRDFVAAVTHLHWDPRWPDVKLLQAHILTTRLEDFVRRHKSTEQPVPLLLAGDFNSLARKTVSDPFDQVPKGGALSSGVYELLTTGTVSWRHPDHPFQRAGWRGAQNPACDAVDIASELAPLHSAYRGADGHEPPLTTKTASFAGCLDYIWVGWGFAVTKLLELPYSAPPGADADDVVGLGPLPNDEFPSDHVALGARLVPPCDLFSL